MSHFDQDTLKDLMKLCCITCSEEEQEALLLDLQKILNYVALLQEVDTHSVAPCYQVLEDLNLVNVMREDVVGETMPRKLFLKNAPAEVGGMIRVPEVIKQT
jgi:aspartyl-tRNA(Asn)/glutamyl-tRNA(Gln) amidotransferase subunit C